MSKYKRTTILRTNKHQKRFFYPIVFSFILGCIISWLMLIYYSASEVQLSDPAFRDLHETIPSLLAITMAMMFVVLFWTFNISNRYLGPHERIIQELDEVIEGKRKGGLETRDSDVIFKELITRINTIIGQKKS